ncbi:MAG: PilN domain-containing protein [Candidatus Zambryskibacteria bacterium]|nr:PilN domain-containing protein [Candidatus Zambryskibacteria bacterium]
MPPKFQSSFIPKGPIASSSQTAVVRRVGQRNFVSSLAYLIFVVSLILAIGVFGYKTYLEYRIKQMSADLVSAKAQLDPQSIEELTNLNNRIVATKTLIKDHRIITPLLEFLEAETPKTVRFTEFQYSVGEHGLEFTLNGLAKGYNAVALLAQSFNQSRYFSAPAFSNLALNDKGEVLFSFKTTVNPELLSYSAVSAASSTPQ